MQKDLIFYTSGGNESGVTLNFADNNSADWVIFVHGFKGFKDWGFWHHIAAEFNRTGFNVLRFNFSHNGTGPHGSEFTRLDLFEENSFSLERKELSEITDALARGEFTESLPRSICLLGHSRGGAMAIFEAAVNSRIKSAALWASVSKLNRYSERQLTDWEQKGYLEFLNTRTRQKMRAGKNLLDDIINQDKKGLNLKMAVKKINSQVIIIHGEQDLTVKPEEAVEIYNNLKEGKGSKLVMLPATGHTFNAEHPFKGTNDKLESAINETIKFFKNILN